MSLGRYLLPSGELQQCPNERPHLCTGLPHSQTWWAWFAQDCRARRLGFSRSWHESQITARETWTPRADQPEVYLSQQEASFKFDAKMHSYLVDQAPTDREAQRLRRIATCGFITAVPSDEDGKDTILPPVSPWPTVSESLCYLSPSLVRCASSPSTLLAITPLAAHLR